MIERDIVERPESGLVLPVGQKNIVMLIEEYDLAADTWQLTLPGGKVIDPTSEGIWQQAQNELREETGFRADKLEKLLDFYSHPDYIAHNYDASVGRTSGQSILILTRMRRSWSARGSISLSRTRRTDH